MKTVLITGGSRGIGAGMVRAFAQAGWRVAFSWHQSQAAALALAAETGALPFQADLKCEKDCLEFISAAVRQLSHLDALIVNAGIAWSGLMTDMPTQDWDALMALNLRSAFILSREALKGMLPRKSGSLLFISSVHGLRGASCEAAYAASKAGLIGLALSLAKEYGPSGIRVNCLAPGVIDTDMMAGCSAPDKEALRLATPLGRLGNPRDVSEAALFLSGEGASFITGQVLAIDGGLII